MGPFLGRSEPAPPYRPLGPPPPGPPARPDPGVSRPGAPGGPRPPQGPPWQRPAPGFEFERGGRAASRAGGTATLFRSPLTVPDPGSARPRRRGSHRTQPVLSWLGRRDPVAEPVPRPWSGGPAGPSLLVALVVLSLLGFAVIIVNANKPAPMASRMPAPVFLPATAAGRDFTPYAAGSTRGIGEFQGRVASAGAEVVSVGAETGQHVTRAEFFVSTDAGRSWTLGTTSAAGGGAPAPGHPAYFVAGAPGAWAAIGPDSIWTSADGRAWTLVSRSGLPRRPGDVVTVLKRTSDGFLAAGRNNSHGRSTPVIFLSAEGTTWRRLVPRLASAVGRTLDIRLAASDGNRILIAGDVGTARSVTGGAWLSEDGGRTWAPVSVPAGHGPQQEFTDAAATAAGFLLVRPATVGGKAAAEVYRSADGATWTLAATLAGFTPGLMNSTPAGAVLAGQSGGRLTAFVSAAGTVWRPAPALGSAAGEVVSGVAATTAGAVIAAGGSAGISGGRQRLITVTGLGGAAKSVSLTSIPGAVQPQLSVDAIAAAGAARVAVGSANGFPAAWVTVNGGGTWRRAAGEDPAVLDRPGIQALTGVAHGSAGWLAVGGGTTGHPAVLISAFGATWSSVDREPAFTARGLVTAQTAASRTGYVIVGYRASRRGRTVAAAWWSAGLAGWHRSAVPAGARTSMLAVTASAGGFVAAGSSGARPAIWITADGRTWAETSLPLPAGATSAVLGHVAASGRAVAAIGVARTAAGRVPFAAWSADGGRSWHEAGLPVPVAATEVTALASAGRFVATGTFPATPGRENVVVWTSASGATWAVATPAGRGLTGTGISAITALAASGGTLSAVGFSATPAGEQPTFWGSLVRQAAGLRPAAADLSRLRASGGDGRRDRRARVRGGCGRPPARTEPPSRARVPFQDALSRASAADSTSKPDGPGFARKLGTRRNFGCRIWRLCFRQVPNFRDSQASARRQALDMSQIGLASRPPHRCTRRGPGGR